MICAGSTPTFFCHPLNQNQWASDFKTEDKIASEGQPEGGTSRAAVNEAKISVEFVWYDILCSSSPVPGYFTHFLQRKQKLNFATVQTWSSSNSHLFCKCSSSVPFFLSYCIPILKSPTHIDLHTATIRTHFRRFKIWQGSLAAL